MKAGKPIAFVVLAFLLGGVAPQLPFAFADSSANPLQALWDAIAALNNKQEDLQSQIDELRTQIQKDNKASPEITEVIVPQSEPSIKIAVERDSGRDEEAASRGDGTDNGIIFHLVASNSGPDKAAGVKLTFFYKLGLLDIQSISAEDGQQCEKPSRGIIQCYVGTINADSEHPITIFATANNPEEEAHVVADISSITQDTDTGNNHADLTFVPNDLASNSVSDSDSNNPDESKSESDSQSSPPQSSSSDSGDDSNLPESGQQNEDTQQEESNNSSNETSENSAEQSTQDNAGEPPQSTEDNSESQSSGTDNGVDEGSQQQEEQQDEGQADAQDQQNGDTGSDSSESSGQDSESSSPDEGGEDNSDG